MPAVTVQPETKDTGGRTADPRNPQEKVPPPEPLPPLADSDPSLQE